MIKLLFGNVTDIDTSETDFVKISKDLITH